MDDVVMHLLLSLCYKQKHNALLIYKFSLVLLLI